MSRHSRSLSVCVSLVHITVHCVDGANEALTYLLSLLTWLTAGCSARLLSERVVQRDVRSTSGSRDTDDAITVVT